MINVIVFVFLMIVLVLGLVGGGDLWCWSCIYSCFVCLGFVLVWGWGGNGGEGRVRLWVVKEWFFRLFWG